MVYKKRRDRTRASFSPSKGIEPAVSVATLGRRVVRVGDGAAAAGGTGGAGPDPGSSDIGAARSGGMIGDVLPPPLGGCHLTTSVGHGPLTTFQSPDNFPTGNLQEKKEDNVGQTGPP